MMMMIPDPVLLEVSKDGVVRAYSLEGGAKVPVESGLITKRRRFLNDR